MAIASLKSKSTATKNCWTTLKPNKDHLFSVKKHFHWTNFWWKILHRTLRHFVEIQKKKNNEVLWFLVQNKHVIFLLLKSTGFRNNSLTSYLRKMLISKRADLNPVKCSSAEQSAAYWTESKMFKKSSKKSAKFLLLRFSRPSFHFKNIPATGPLVLFANTFPFTSKINCQKENNFFLVFVRLPKWAKLFLTRGQRNNILYFQLL